MATYELKINSSDPRELAKIMAAVVPISGAADVKCTQHAAAIPADKPEPKEVPTPPEAKAEKAPTAPSVPPEPPKAEPVTTAKSTVTIAMLQTVGRQLAAAGRGKDVQELVRKYGATFISRVPEEHREELYAAMQALAGQPEAKDNAT